MENVFVCNSPLRNDVVNTTNTTDPVYIEGQDNLIELTGQKVYQ